MSDLDFVNGRLKGYLDSKEYRYTQYKELIKAVIKDDSNIKAKYNLYCLLMNYGTNKIVVDNLSQRLEELYRSDENINTYLDDAIRYNPKLGYVSIEAHHQRDMKNNCSRYIHIPCRPEQADHIMETAKEVLTMMLMEVKTIPNK